ALSRCRGSLAVGSLCRPSRRGSRGARCVLRHEGRAALRSEEQSGPRDITFVLPTPGRAASSPKPLPKGRTFGDANFERLGRAVFIPGSKVHADSSVPRSGHETAEQAVNFRRRAPPGAHDKRMRSETECLMAVTKSSMTARIPTDGRLL